MKIFVATSKGQNGRKSDFCSAEEGELLTFALECERDKEDCDGRCGCRRSLLGIDSNGVTTTFAVAELPLKSAQYEERVISYFSAKGWFDISDESARAIFANDAIILLEEAARFPVGIVLEKRGDTIQIRQPVHDSGISMIARGRLLAEHLKATQ